MRRIITARLLVTAVNLVVAGLGLAASPATAAEWPNDEWAELARTDEHAHRALLERPACRDDFIPFATKSAHLPEGLKTDGLVVIRGGAIAYEYYDPQHDRSRPHCLWSASKAVTVTILGAAIHSGVALPGGHGLGLDSPVHEIFRPELRPAQLRRRDDAQYRALRIMHLVRMAAGFEWEESYEGAVRESTVLPMLYLRGHRDMALFALRRPMIPEGPGVRWKYSGGNSNLIMAILKHAYGPRYAQMPWDILFSSIGMKFDPAGKTGVVIERDGAGTFVGSTYIFMAPRDMARIGYLYLNDGIWKAKRLLPDGWVAQARAFNSAQANLKLGAEYVEYVNREGLFSNGGFWLNLEVPGLMVQFPRSPRDMFFAAGHYGQLIIILPTQNLVIARTGHDAEYWSKIDHLVSKAIACFAGS